MKSKLIKIEIFKSIIETISLVILIMVPTWDFMKEDGLWLILLTIIFLFITSEIDDCVERIKKIINE